MVVQNVMLKLPASEGQRQGAGGTLSNIQELKMVRVPYGVVRKGGGPVVPSA